MIKPIDIRDEDNRPLVSIVIPAWNAEKTLKSCLDSIFCQTFRDLEILIVDDGSTDRTPDIIRQYQEKYTGIRSLRVENHGVSAARNAALPLCRGTYTRFVDSDDILPSGSMEALVTLARETNADLVLAGYRSIIAGKASSHALIHDNRTMDLPAFLDWMHPKANTFYIGSLWNKLFRTELIHKSGIRFTSGLTYGEDFLFVMNYLESVRHLAFTAAPVYEYIRHPGSLSTDQILDCVVHPLTNIRVKQQLYRGMCSVYRETGLYRQYRNRLWLYLFRVTLNE